MKADIVLLPGDGIGPEVVGEAVTVLRQVAQTFGHTFSFAEHLIGGIAMDKHGTALTDHALDACRKAHAILLGAVGGPKWDDPKAAVRPEQGLLRLRKDLGLFANLRPVTLHPALADASPLKAERLAGVDLLVVRELTGGVYFGKPRLREQTPAGIRAVDTMEYTEPEIERVVHLACRAARERRKKVTSVDKANVLETSRLWREVATRVGLEYPDVQMDHQLVDSAAMRLITHAPTFDVIVTENMFGDILTDEASVLSGSLGLLPSASIGETKTSLGVLGVYEPIHGSAPDIAGTGKANPLGTIASAAMLLRHSLGLHREAAAVEAAVHDAIGKKVWTPDLGGTLRTADVGRAVCEHIAATRQKSTRAS